MRLLKLAAALAPLLIAASPVAAQTPDLGAQIAALVQPTNAARTEVVAGLLRAAGFEPSIETFAGGGRGEPMEGRNVVASFGPETGREILLVAHYDAVVLQDGTLSRPQGSLDIRAWTVASDIGLRFPDVRLQPRLGIKADIASGDANPNDGRLQTFNALYPKAAYFSEASLLAPANLMDVQPTLTLTPRQGLTTEFGWQLAWKHRRNDAIYTTPTPLSAIPGSAGTARRIGQQFKWETTWKASPHWQWQGQLAWFEAGPGLRQSGGRNTLFASVVGAWQW